MAAINQRVCMPAIPIRMKRIGASRHLLKLKEKLIKYGFEHINPAKRENGGSNRGIVKYTEVCPDQKKYMNYYDLK